MKPNAQICSDSVTSVKVPLEIQVSEPQWPHSRHWASQHHIHFNTSGNLFGKYQILTDTDPEFPASTDNQI